MEKLEVGYRYDFGQLKPGDKFAWKGLEYEKVSGNFAARLFDDQPTEIPEGIQVYLYEKG